MALTTRRNWRLETSNFLVKRGRAGRDPYRRTAFGYLSFIRYNSRPGPDKNPDAQQAASRPNPQPERIFTRDLLAGLNYRRDRPWGETFKGKEITELWLASQLRPFGVRPHNLWIDGVQAKGYSMEDFLDVFPRYISKSELEALKAELQPATPPPEKNDEPRV